ncbi:MAG: 3-hydroxybutyryl-CoA dehydrogenase [Thermoleophilia bacterium]|nr:3-hydroxybutyryl-CoA dehydrogenase [Thermoleophilia bacterium]
MPAASTTSPAPPNSENHFSSVAVIGFGTMGSGIAQVCAQAELDVAIVERDEKIIERDMAAIARQFSRAVEKGRMTSDAREKAIARLHPSTDLQHALSADLIIEAIPERLDLKLDLVRALDASTPHSTIIATNTSALSVTEIAAAATRPDRVCGLHWFNPPPVLPLVEVVRAERTSDTTIERAISFVRQVGKHPIVCRDTPGFVVNRILIPVLNDAVTLWDQGLASAEDIDNGCRMGLNWPIGPLALCDLVGLDVAVHAAEALYASQPEPRMAPPAALIRMVKAGKLGRKSGEGFYTYD